MANDIGWTIDEIARDLDLIVFELEVAPPDDLERLVAERRKLRQRLERVRDRLQDTATKLI